MRGSIQKVTNRNAHESELHKFATEASDIGLPVGEFPQHLKRHHVMPI
jgi:hypothetical protein